MKKFSEMILEQAIDYHLKNKVAFSENVFRPHTLQSNLLFKEAKKLYEQKEYTPKDWFEEELLQSDIGETALYEELSVPLDFPLEEEVELNKPRRGGSKKYYVYVKDPKTGNVKKIEFGAKGGGSKLAVKIDDEQARKSFAARHRCSDQNDKMSAAYWACRLPHFKSSVGLSGPNQKMYW